MQANKTLYKSNVLSIIECKSRIETVFYCSYPNRGTNQYTRWLVSLSRDRKLAIMKKPTLRIKRSKKELLNYEWSPFSLRDSRASETRTRVNITSREKGETRRWVIFLSPRRVSPFSRGVISSALAFRSLYCPWGKMGTTRSLGVYNKMCRGGPGAGRTQAPAVSNASHIPDHFSLVKWQNFILYSILLSNYYSTVK